MKLTVFLVACMALVAVQAASVQNDLKPVELSFLEMQEFILKTLVHISKEPQDEAILKLAEPGLIVDKSYYTKYTDYMVKFYNAYKLGDLLPKSEFFSKMQGDHVMQETGLFGFFVYAKDWATLVNNLAWARVHVNPAMYVSALTLVVIHRGDLESINLPPIYEIFPEMFFASKYILAAESFDWDVFNKQIMLEKEFPAIYGKQSMYPNDIIGNRFHARDWKTWQWWKLMGLDDGWHDGQGILSELKEAISYVPMLSSMYENKKIAWMPIDYTRDIELFNEDSELSYFTEDLDWNAYWYYLNMDYAKGLEAKEFHLDKDRRGEWWIYNVQQLLARYYMERLSNGLGEISALQWTGIYKPGYDSQLIAYNGVGFTYRKNYWEVQSYQKPELLKKILGIEGRIMSAIDSGKYVMTDGTVIDLSKPESIEYIGNMLQGNIDVLDKYFFGYWWFYASQYLTGEGYYDYSVIPNVLMNYETMMRDPIFYSLMKLAVYKYYLFKNHLGPYTHEELLLPGVKIEDVVVSELKTFFDFDEADLTNLINEKQVYHDGKLVWDKVLIGRHLRLNHKPFNYELQVVSDKVQKVVVRVFIAPEFNQYGEKLTMTQNRENYMELDEFILDLVAGKNVFKRNSDDFEWTFDSKLSFSEFYNYVEGAVEGKYKFEKNFTSPYNAFPERLILPHGWVKGFPVNMFFMISPYVADHQQYSSYDPSYMSGVGSGVRHIDNMPFGYPLDRPIEDLYEFKVPNMFYKPVKVYHEEKYTKYYPKKWEKYGSFDYDF